ncbi:HNH endonuclease [Priestia aryabhattai]|uniref:HNH endonuclease n=1 Tax=Priestia aryabhattai TaxID=412384 RepID=UPI003B686063
MRQDFSNFKLKIDWKPAAFRGHSVKRNISQSLWRKIRKQILEEREHKCRICGYEPDEVNLRYLELHEIERYDEDNLICTLEGMDLICKRCHAFHHLGFTLSRTTEEQFNELIQHFIKVNNCTEEEFIKHYKSIREKKTQRVPDITKMLRTIDEKETVKYRITGDIPYKESVIVQLDKKGVYRESV